LYDLPKRSNWNKSIDYRGCYDAVMAAEGLFEVAASFARGAFFSGNSDERIHKSDGTILDVRMPPIASTYNEFLRLCETCGRAASAAVA
jgi:hypothetical protein